MAAMRRLACLAMVSLALIATLAACSDGGDDVPVVEPEQNCADGLCLTVPASGFQLRTEGTEIAAGEDVEYCEVLELPGDPSVEYYVTRFEVAMSQYSHHLIVSAVKPDTAEGEAWQVGDRKLCAGLDAIASVPVTGSQHPYHDEPFPAGVGRVYHGGQKVIFDYHYFNTGSAPVSAHAAVNFHTSPPEQVTRIAKGLSAFNVQIAVPPMQTKSFTADCVFNADVMLFKVTRHTHQWGRDFDVAFMGGEPIWTSADYEDTDYLLPEPVLVREGEGLTFTCEFENTTEDMLYYGLTASDEMCNLFGAVYAPEGVDDVPPQTCFIF
jgi:hypothetical protein